MTAAAERIIDATVIDITPSVKGFALRDILSLASGLSLPGADVHGLVAFLTATDKSAQNTAVNGKDARDCLMEQLPFLKNIDITLLHMAFKQDRAQLDAHLSLWLDAQQKNYGDEHFLMPQSRWQRRKNSHKL